MSRKSIVEHVDQWGNKHSTQRLDGKFDGTAGGAAAAGANPAALGPADIEPPREIAVGGIAIHHPYWDDDDIPDWPEALPEPKVSYAISDSGRAGITVTWGDNEGESAYFERGEDSYYSSMDTYGAEEKFEHLDPAVREAVSEYGYALSRRAETIQDYYVYAAASRHEQEIGEAIAKRDWTEDEVAEAKAETAIANGVQQTSHPAMAGVLGAVLKRGNVSPERLAQLTPEQIDVLSVHLERALEGIESDLG